MAEQPDPLSCDLDRRIAERLPLALEVAYDIEAGHRTVSGTARTVDVSGLGFRMVLPQLVAPRASCRLRVTLPDGATLPLEGRIVWCRPRPETSPAVFETAIAFTPPASPHDAIFAQYSQFIAAQLLASYLRGE